MKTSNKLLVTIVGILVGSLLTYDIALKAEYRTGAYKNVFRHFTALSLRDFDEVQAAGNNLDIRLTPGAFGVRVDKYSAPYIQVRQAGRRLLVTTSFPKDSQGQEKSIGGMKVLISCPALTRVRTTGDQAVYVDDFTLDSLTIEQNGAGAVTLANNTLGFLRATTGPEAGPGAELHLKENNRIAGANLTVRHKSGLSLENVFIPQFACQFSDSASVTISGKSLRMMKR
ncbi:hypothetical protein GCM10022408_24660 [Hymenobacter fastidiosus]|uniref:Auto-transporter adhesin head GIN domain-containing protein n=1 Tax=Hymenobacter fastidiosus TaxID=486264 RepID=A0ABP7SG31_9BACT